MQWRKPLSSAAGHDDETSSRDKYISLQRVSGSVNDLLQEFNSQWKSYLKHSYITSQQSNYIKEIKENAGENGTIIVNIDFAENHTLLKQNEIMQAHWTNPQAALFTIHLKINKDKHQSMVIISDYLVHDVEFLHAAQGIISDYVVSVYPGVKQLNYVSDGATQHFKNNKNILNLTYHQTDFGIPAVWSFSATAHGKSAVDGIGAAVKHRATKRVLNGNTADAILTPQELFRFAQQDISINVFYLSKERIKHNEKQFGLHGRWSHNKTEGKLSVLFQNMTTCCVLRLCTRLGQSDS